MNYRVGAYCAGDLNCLGANNFTSNWLIIKDLKDKTINDNLMYIPNDYAQNSIIKL